MEGYVPEAVDPDATQSNDDDFAPPVVTTPEDVAEEAPEPAEPADPGDNRRPRGWLEAEVKAVLEGVLDGSIDRPEGPLTAHRVSNLVAKHKGIKAPSAGAVAAVFARWEKVGGVVMSEKPVGFLDFSPEAKAQGIENLKANAKAARKAASVPAATPGTPDQAPVGPEAGTEHDTQGSAPVAPE